MAGPFDDTLGAGFPAQQDQAGGILKILSGMKPQDPAAINPATTAAMAQSRDAVTKMLQRQLQQMDSPFAGLSDVATAAQTALATRGKTPVGATLESLDQNRISKATQIANTLSQVANREASVGSKGATTPYQAAQLAMSQLRFLAQRGDKDAQLAENAIDNIRTSLDPEDAVGFVVDAHSALQEAQRRAGRGLTGQEAAMVVTETAKAGKYRAKQVGVNIVPSPFGGFYRTDNRAGTVTEVTPGVPWAIPSPAPRLPSPVGSPPPAYMDAQPAGPPPGATTPEPVLGGRVAQNPAQPATAPSVSGIQATPAQRGALAIDLFKQQRQAGTFNTLAEQMITDAKAAGPSAFGALGMMSRYGGAAIEQARSLIQKAGPESTQASELLQKIQNPTPILDGLVRAGAVSAGLRAGVITLAYSYARANNEKGTLSNADFDIALKTLGEGLGSVQQFETAVRRLQQTMDIKHGGATSGANGLPGNAEDLKKLTDDEVLRAIGAR